MNSATRHSKRLAIYRNTCELIQASVLSCVRTKDAIGLSLRPTFAKFTYGRTPEKDPTRATLKAVAKHSPAPRTTKTTYEYTRERNRTNAPCMVVESASLSIRAFTSTTWFTRTRSRILVNCAAKRTDRPQLLQCTGAWRTARIPLQTTEESLFSWVQATNRLARTNQRHSDWLKMVPVVMTTQMGTWSSTRPKLIRPIWSVLPQPFYNIYHLPFPSVVLDLATTFLLSQILHSWKQYVSTEDLQHIGNSSNLTQLD